METRTAGAPRAAAEVSPRTAARAAVRETPYRRPDLAHLSLGELRDYRRELSAEEGRVSYWRRIIQARLDVLRAGAAGGAAALDSDSLAPVLAGPRVGSGRQVLVDVVPSDDFPPLPDLASLWARSVDVDDRPALAALEADLDEAELRLSEYRTAVHARIADATGELIARYREDPRLCLSALPLPPQRVARA